MSRRGREIADAMAVKFMERAGVNKAQTSGQAISDYFRPVGESVAKIEKGLASVAAAQKDLVRRQKEQLARERDFLDYEAEVLTRAENLLHGDSRAAPGVSEQDIARRADGLVKRRMQDFNPRDHAPEEKRVNGSSEPWNIN